jgi:hypothetical protein
MRNCIITIFLIFQLVILLSCSKNDNLKNEAQVIQNNNSNQEIVNVIENRGNPIKLAIEVDGLDSKYVSLKKVTQVDKCDSDIFITFKNINILSYEDAHKHNTSEVMITTDKSNWHLYGKNLISVPNTLHYGIYIENLSNRVCNVTISKVFNINNNQILVKPITFKLKISNKVKSLN